MLADALTVTGKVHKIREADNSDCVLIKVWKRCGAAQYPQKAVLVRAYRVL